MQRTHNFGSRMSLDQFPPEILATVFKYLSEYEVKTVSDVSTRWRDIASNWVLVPRAHLLLTNAPDGVRQTPFHTVHIDGATPNLLHLFDQHKHHLTNLNSVVLYGVWTDQRLIQLSHCLGFLPNMTTLEVSGASPSHHIFDFLSIRHNFTKLRCFLNENQTKSFRKLCQRLETTHGLFEEVLVTQRTYAHELKVYSPKPRLVKYPGMHLTTSLTIHPARLANRDFDEICRLKFLTNLTLNHPKQIPGNLPPTLRKLELNNAKTVSHASWVGFFQSPVVNSLEELSISGQNKIDSSIFDSLGKNRNLGKLYLEMHSSCADQCGIKSLLSWCSNVRVLVLHIPYSSDGVHDLVNINRDDVRRLQTLNILFQVTPDVVEPKSPERVKPVADMVRAVLPGVFVKIQIKSHMREFLCNDEDDFE